MEFPPSLCSCSCITSAIIDLLSYLDPLTFLDEGIRIYGMGYALRIALPTNSKRRLPAMATTNDVRLNPETSTPKSMFARKPPTIAPTIPSTIAPTIPPLDGCGSIALATVPAIKPNMIQPNMLIVHLLLG